MRFCNDGACPLNRQGVPHESHELIERRSVTNPCNDARCAMNRMGIKHNVHDESYTDHADNKDTFTSSSSSGFDGHDTTDRSRAGSFDSESDIGGQAFAGRFHNTKAPEHDSEFEHIETPDEALEELLKRVRRDTGSQSRRHASGTDHTAASRPKKKPHRQQARAGIPEESRILNAGTPYTVFGIPKNATNDEIKSRFRELAIKYGPAAGMLNKSVTEKERANKIMAKINKAHADLKAMRKGAS